MTFLELEKAIRRLIGENKIKESIQLLNDNFKTDSDLDEIALQSAKYHSILERQLRGTVDNLEVDLALNKLRSDILQFLRSKEEYLNFKKQTFGNREEELKNNTKYIKVFFSVGSPHNKHQLIYINKLKDYFKENGILLETLKGWEDQDPLAPILEELKSSYGCLVLALERYFVANGTSKRGSDQEGKIVDQSFASPWLHIEAALARTLDMPLIILKDKALTNEGLIHNDKQEWGIVRISQDNINEIDEYPIKHFILNWIKQVKKQRN